MLPHKSQYISSVGVIIDRVNLILGENHLDIIVSDIRGRLKN